MTRKAGMLRILRKHGVAVMFSIAAGFMVSLAVAPARAADLLANEKILEALKAKRLTRCPVTSVRPRCGGARLHHPLPKGPLSMSR